MCMMGMCVPVLLLALAAGYLVLVKAGTAEEGLKKIGKVIGWVIIAVAIVSLILSFSCGKACMGKRGCGMMGKGRCSYMGSKHNKHMKGMKGMKWDKEKMDESCPSMKEKVEDK